MPLPLLLVLLKSLDHALLYDLALLSAHHAEAHRLKVRRRGRIEVGGEGAWGPCMCQHNIWMDLTLPNTLSFAEEVPYNQIMPSKLQ